MTNKELYKERNKNVIYQLEKDTDKIINIFHSNSEVNIYFKKNEGNGHISDALRGRNNSHYAYGFDWYRKDDYIKKFGEVTKVA